jgi:hypothetical protein
LIKPQLLILLACILPRLSFLPLADPTRVTLDADWPHPVLQVNGMGEFAYFCYFEPVTYKIVKAVNIVAPEETS